MRVQGTSLEVYYNVVRPELGTMQQKVFETIERSKNITNAELAQVLGWTINRVTPRTNELVKAGLVCEDERRICNFTKHKAIAWKIVRNTLF